MIDPACSPEVAGIIEYLAASGVPHRVTSTWRPGAMTAAGNPSRHGRKLAVDFAGPRPGRDSEDLADIFHAFVPVAQALAELIYAGPQVSYNIKAGRRVGKYAQRIHHDHVHVAVNPGVVLMETPMVLDASPDVDPAPEHVGEDMADPVAALFTAEGATVVTKTGGVFTYGDHPFHGSYFSLAPEHRNDPDRVFVAIDPRDDGAAGYQLVSAGGEIYRFP